jgi:hypothetical protein
MPDKSGNRTCARQLSMTNPLVRFPRFTRHIKARTTLSDAFSIQLLGGLAKPGERLESFVGPPLFRPNFRSDYGIEVLNLEVDPR